MNIVSKDSNRIKLLLIFVIDLIFLLSGIIAAYRLQFYPSLGFKIHESTSGLKISNGKPDLSIYNDALLVKLDTTDVKYYSDVLYVLERKTSFEKVILTLMYNGKEYLVPYTLTQSYPLQYVIIAIFIGLFIWFSGLIIYYKQPDKLSARITHWALICLYVCITTTTEQAFNNSSPLFIYLLRFLYLTGYSFIPLLFLFFTLNFPRKEIGFLRFIGKVAILPCIIFMAIFFYLQYQICFFNSIDAQRNYISILTFFYINNFIWLGSGIFIMIYRYHLYLTSDERKQMRWIVWGISIAVLPFIFTRILPQTLGFDVILSEQVTNIFFIFIPLSFVIAIIKEHIFDIDVIINRSVVYGILTIMIVLIYVLVTGFLAGLLSQIISNADIIILTSITLAIALLFNPTKNHLQRLVDKIFYRMKYDFKIVLENIKTNLSKSYTINNLSETLTIMLMHYLQVNGIILIFEKEDEYFPYWAQGDLSDVKINNIELLSKVKESFHPIVLQNSSEPTRLVKIVDHIDPDKFVRLLVPIKSETGNIFGAIGFCKKKTDQKFFVEEIAFIMSVTEIISVLSQRVFLQESLIIEQLEKKRLIQEKKELEILQKLRQDLSSMIVHDLRNPLSSLILSITEAKNSISDRLNELENKYLNYAIHSGNQLLELINDLLEIHKMEEGKMTLTRVSADVKEMIDNAVFQLEMLIKAKSIIIETELPDDKILINVDKEKIIRVLTNLISNAIKFSPKNSKIKIKFMRSNSDDLIIYIQDFGPGIPSEYIDKVFDKFVQLESGEKRQRISSGLGLTYCKLAIENHGGKIWAESQPGVGSTFFIKLPLKI